MNRNGHGERRESDPKRKHFPFPPLRLFAIPPSPQSACVGVRMSARFVLMLAATLLAAVGVVCVPVLRGQDAKTRTHRDTFAKGTEPAWGRGDANIEFDEKANAIDSDHAHEGGTSERIKIEANPPPGSTAAEFVHYYYRTPATPLSDDFAAGVYVKSARGGVQLKARVVLPRERDPKNPDTPLTVLVGGETYADRTKWKQLTLTDVKGGLKKQQVALTARLGHGPDTSDAYVDHLVLNVYTGAGVSEVWIDSLSVGPVPASEPDAPGGTGGKRPTKRKPPSVSFSNGDILIDMHDDKPERPFFMRAIRHSGVPLGVLEQARFNTVWFPGTVSDDTYEAAVKAKFFLVPSLPLPDADWDAAKPNQNAADVLEKDAELVSKTLKRFGPSDAVLMWDLGSGRTTNQVRRVARLADAVRTLDPRRPRVVDLWDGYADYSNYVEAVGGHRWPLFTSLEMLGYRDWLSQRRALTSPGKLNVTNIQTHLPEWYQKVVFGRPDCDKFDAPVGPHPEQIRLLTYLAIASGYRGLTFWSDQFLSNATHGQPRLLEIAQLNVELEFLEPLLLAAPDAPTWKQTNNPNVLAAVLTTGKEIVVLPIWVGRGSQYVPDQMTDAVLSVVVPRVPEGATAWRITAAGAQELKGLKHLSDGTQVDIPDFDTTAAVVFTTDLSGKSRVARWQENTKNVFARTAAYWARRQAYEQYNQTCEVHKQILAAGGPEVPDVLKLFKQSADQMELASKFTDNDQPEQAYAAARRALRPLRIVAREHWRLATEKLDSPTASPYAVSFYSLPLHHQLAAHVRTSRPGGNVLPHGGFELSEDVGKVGAAITSLPGWKVRTAALDPVLPSAGIYDTTRDKLKDEPIPPPACDYTRYAPGRPVPSDADRDRLAPKPTLGQQFLYLGMSAKAGNEPPQALERSFVAVDSPTVDLPPGSWARVQFWVKTPGVGVSPDALLVYDSSGGEPLGVRLNYAPRWERRTLYRRVPDTGKLSVTFALTGTGEAYIDDVSIEPLVPAAGPTVPVKPIAALYQLDRTAAPKPRPLTDDTKTLPSPREYDTQKPPAETLPQPRPLPDGNPLPLPAIPLPAAPRPLDPPPTRRPIVEGGPLPVPELPPIPRG